MLISINPRKAFLSANIFAKLAYFTFIAQAVAVFAFAVTRGSLFGGKASLVIAILDALLAYLIVDTGLLFLRGKPNGVKIGFVFSLLTGAYYIHSINHSSLNIVGAGFSVLTILMLALPQSRKHIVHKPKKSMVAPKPER